MPAAAAKIVEADPAHTLELRGAARQLMGAREHEVIISGPSDTGKTLPCCVKAHLYCLRKPGCEGAIMRKTAASLAGTVLKTFAKVIPTAVRPFGGENPSRFIYPNGSQVWCGGLDNPDRVLSSERDFIYVCQAEELTLNDWEYLATRCSGRAGHVKFPQLFGDCNPGGSRHWIRQRAAEGKLRLLISNHKDNPSIYDKTGNLTPEGQRRIAVLENLTGIRRLRLKEGIWATAEGAVYDMFNSSADGPHVMTRPWQEMVKWMLCQDEGYTNPAAILLVGEDGDGRWHVFREWYECGKLEQDVVAVARRWYFAPVVAACHIPDEQIEQAAQSERFAGLNERMRRCVINGVDEAAAGLIAALSNAGMNAVGGKGRILDGIHGLQDRLKVQGDGKARLTVDPSCLNTINEFESYVWKPEKDVPVDANNHALGALRYLQDVTGKPVGFASATVFGSGPAPNPFGSGEAHPELGTL